MADEITENTPIPQDTGVNMGSGTSETPPEAGNAPVDNSTPEVVNNTTSENTENSREIALVMAKCPTVRDIVYEVRTIIQQCSDYIYIPDLAKMPELAGMI